MGAHLEEHGIWGTPERVIECLERHRRFGGSVHLRLVVQLERAFLYGTA